MSYAIIGINMAPNSWRNHPMPMVTGADNDDEAKWALFLTRADAKKAAEAHPYFKASGYKIIEWPFCEANQKAEL